ncbi:ATP-dependent DNA helicase RecG [Candidatus Bipolaricaulota bacterium]|nr:ATP-dependent DNA helicase RecG [Candidatus Bipolaricaulota bacterium]
MPQENSDWQIRIRKVLDLERATGYDDRAATCGLEAFVRLQHPASIQWIEGYAAATPAARQSMIDDLIRSLSSDDVRAASQASSLPHEPDLTEPISRAHGIGSKRATLLAKLGLNTMEDLLMFFPHRLEDRTQVTRIGLLKDGMDVSVRGAVHAIQKVRMNRGMTLVKASIADGTGFLSAVWFNQPWVADQIKRGMMIDVFGHVERSYGELQMKSPIWEPEGMGVEIGRWVPVYPATEGITVKSIRSLIHKNLDRCLPGVRESLSTDMRSQFRLMSRREAVETIHRPQNPAAFERARRSLAFEEFFLLQLGLLRSSRSEVGRTHAANNGLLESFFAGLRFTLTAAQRGAIDEILSDLSKPVRMMRLLQGDVGSGKTLVALAAAIAVIDSGCQVAYMAPTEILAEQHALTFERMLSGLPVAVQILTGNTAGKTTINERIANGDVDLLVGTHALIQESVSFKDLGLVIIDEQHRFGVVQRSAIEEKGDRVDLLVMSATPIPRTITLTLYGEFDTSVLDEMPMGPRSIETQWIEASKRDALYEKIGRMLDEGRKGYVVLPLVEESEKVEANAAIQVANELTHRFPVHGVGLIHGRLASAEKAKAMEAFRDGETQLLVATTVIEVGIDVQDADFMVIEDADRFGLSQLHQLRGRIGRAGQPSWCFALADAGTEEGKERLAAFQEHLDGFAIAEEDLRIRGPGDLVGTQQHGYFTLLRAVDLMRDLDLMRRAREAAKAAYAQGISPELTDLIEQRFGEMIRWIRV